MCWLCIYQGEEVGRRLNNFIIKHIGVIDVSCIACQVSDYLLVHQPDAEGAEKNHVSEHISKHMLHPRVRLAVMLRQLLEFSSFLQGNLIINDESGQCAVEKGNVELYLKVSAQIMTLYRADTQGMLFSDDDFKVSGNGEENSNLSGR